MQEELGQLVVVEPDIIHPIIVDILVAPVVEEHVMDGVVLDKVVLETLAVTHHQKVTMAAQAISFHQVALDLAVVAAPAALA